MESPFFLFSEQEVGTDFLVVLQGNYCAYFSAGLVILCYIASELLYERMVDRGLNVYPRSTKADLGS